MAPIFLVSSANRQSGQPYNRSNPLLQFAEATVLIEALFYRSAMLLPYLHRAVAATQERQVFANTRPTSARPHAIYTHTRQIGLRKIQESCSTYASSTKATLTLWKLFINTRDPLEDHIHHSSMK